MIDYTKALPAHTETFIGDNDLFLEIYEGVPSSQAAADRPPLLFVHGAYTGSWMWSKYVPHFVREGWTCYAMNLRSHYRSRVLDMTRVTFEDYLEDIREVIRAAIAERGKPPVVIGFSMGGILGQKLAETDRLAGLILVDSVISKEVHDLAPYPHSTPTELGLVVPAPAREELSSIDESEDDILFQRKYLAMESAHAYRAFSHRHTGGVPIDSGLIVCPCLVIGAVGSEDDDRRGRAMAEYLHAEYAGLWNTTHTGLLVGQRYGEAVERILAWLKRFL